MLSNTLYKDESFLQFLWQHRLTSLSSFTTKCGQEVQVINPGFINTDAGPDFFNAKVKIGDVLWAGNVEIHTKSSEWENHKHHLDKAYDNVVLHVVHQYTKPIFSHKGNEIPTIEIDAQPSVLDQYEIIKDAKRHIPCSDYVKNIDPFFINNYRDRLVIERMERKAANINQMLVNSNGDWEQVFFQMLCRSLGSSINADAFEQLGRSLSFRIIAKHRDNLMQLEALVFGQAGFLDQELDDTYHLLLKKEYKFLKSKYSLNPIDLHLWKFLRLRPSNFPTVRLAQLSQLLYKNNSLLHLILSEDIVTLQKSLSSSTSPYWDNHYQFAKLSATRKKHLGVSAINSIMINAVSSVLFCYGKYIGNDSYCDKAFAVLEELPSESNSIINKWKEYGIICNNAYASQAHIQLFTEYCKHKKCLHCNIGHHFLSLQH